VKKRKNESNSSDKSLSGNNLLPGKRVKEKSDTPVDSLIHNTNSSGSKSSAAATTQVGYPVPARDDTEKGSSSIKPANALSMIGGYGDDSDGDD
jgi:hypothetical protein